jgi:hypothetical protein
VHSQLGKLTTTSATTMNIKIMLTPWWKFPLIQQRKNSINEDYVQSA